MYNTQIQDLLNKLQVPSLMTDLEGNLKFVNEDFIRKYQVADLKRINDGFKSTKFSSVSEWIASSRKCGGERHSHEFNFIINDNSKHTFNASASSIDGGYVITIEDFTALRLVESERNEAQTDFKEVLDWLPHPILIATLTMEVKYINPYFTNTYGYTLEDIPTGAAWFEKAYPDVEERIAMLKVYSDYQERIKERLNTDKNYYRKIITSWEVTCKDGKKIPMVSRFLYQSDKKIFFLFSPVGDARPVEWAFKSDKDKLDALLKMSALELKDMNAYL
ncbi:MAG TPA: PAS domain-containing protein, partial [Candidatus Wallbacteria bacterium]|nr:PAS domain-containing protein [Candidatus Wallbacteria bacterium]